MTDTPSNFDPVPPPDPSEGPSGGDETPAGDTVCSEPEPGTVFHLYLTTGYLGELTDASARAQGIGALVEKPFTLAQLTETLHRVLPGGKDANQS